MLNQIAQNYKRNLASTKNEGSVRPTIVVIMELHKINMNRKEKNMIELKNVSKTYAGNVKAVDNVTLKIEPGSVYGF